jgi:hypothetical protein
MCSRAVQRGLAVHGVYCLQSLDRWSGVRIYTYAHVHYICVCFTRLADPLSKKPTKYLEAELRKRDCEMPQVEMFCRALQEVVPVSGTCFLYNKPFSHKCY